MRPFEYARAGEASEAVSLGGRFIAGGTNLLDLMKLQVETPDKLVDITRLPMRDIEASDDGGLRIGALVTNSDLAADRRIRDDYPVLSRALLAGAVLPPAKGPGTGEKCEPESFNRPGDEKEGIAARGTKLRGGESYCKNEETRRAKRAAEE